jgi:mono/diheme cytochrome c family protein
MRSRVQRKTAFLFAGAVAAGLAGAALGQDNGSGVKGKQVFMQARCFACHGEYGFGGVGPRFRENRFLGINDYVVGQILVGRGIMPSFAEALGDDQIAAVATYLRTSWGNNFGPVKPQEVAKVRNEIKLKPPRGPHLGPTSAAPPGGARPPSKPLPPGEPLPPNHPDQ